MFSVSGMIRSHSAPNSGVEKSSETALFSVNGMPSFAKKMRKQYSNNVWKRDINFFRAALAWHTIEIYLIKEVGVKDETGESQVKVLIWVHIKREEGRNWRKVSEIDGGYFIWKRRSGLRTT